MLTHIKEVLMTDAQVVLKQAWDELDKVITSWNGQPLTNENKDTHRGVLFIEVGSEWSKQWAFHDFRVIATVLNCNRFVKLLEVIRSITPDFIINIEPRHNVDWM